MAKLAVAVLALVALMAVAEAQGFAGRTAPGAFCRHSCYSGPGVTCKGAVDTKTQVLTLSKIPFKVDASSCTTKAVTGCDVLILQSWPSKAQHDAFQVAEDTIPQLANLRKALPSANPQGFPKSGPCAGFKTPL